MSLIEYAPKIIDILSAPIVFIYGQNLFNNNFPLNIPRIGNRTVNILLASGFLASLPFAINQLNQRLWSVFPNIDTISENKLCKWEFTNDKAIFNDHCTLEKEMEIRNQWLTWKIDKNNEEMKEYEINETAKRRAEEERDRISKEEARIELEEWRNKFQAEINKDKEEHRLFKEEMKEIERRRINPTPEEQREDDIQSINRILKEKPYMEIPLRLSHPWFFIGKKMCDSECKEEARKVLGVNSDANCQEIRKKFLKLSRDGAHPDKNLDNSNGAFIKISNAYESLCQYKK